MKLSHTEIAGEKDGSKKAAAGRQNALSRAIARYAAIGTMALALPLASQNARAQPAPEDAQPVPTAPVEAPAEAPAPQPAEPELVAPPQPAPQPSPAGITVRGSRRAVLSCPQGSFEVYPVSSQQNLHPAIPLTGPGQLTVRFYPAVLSERFTTPESEYPRQIEYTLAPSSGAARQGSFGGAVRRSECTCAAEVAGSLVVGTPLESTIQVPSGSHTLTVNSPNGLLQTVRFEEILAPVPRPPIRPDQPPAVAAPETQPSQDGDGAHAFRRPLFSFDGEIVRLHSIGTEGVLEDGSSGNSGALYRALLMGTIPLSDHFGIMVGGAYSHNGLTLTTTQAETSLGSHGGTLGLGFSYINGDHYVYALAMGGYRGINTSVLSFADSRSIDEWSHGGEFLGVGGYRYSHFFGLQVEGGNNPFNPLAVRAFGAIPFTWAEPMYPWLEADFLWLHTLVPRESPDFVGLTSLSENAFQIRALAGLPIYRLGPIVPFAVGGGEFNIAGGSLTSGTGIFGGGLRADFLDSLEIEGIGAATLHGDPLVMLRLIYSR